MSDCGDTFKSFINTRIKKIQQLKSNKNASLKIGLILPLLTAFFLIFQVNSQTEIKYIEMDTVNSISENEHSSEKNTIYLEENKEDVNDEIPESKSDFSTESDSKKLPDTTVVSTTSIKATILKTTTEASLKNIKRLLKRNEIKFDYSSLKYDKDKNITQISMFFIDKNGKNHHFSILGDQPTPEIQLIVSDDFTGFKTFTNTNQTSSIDRSSAIILNGKQSSDFDKELKEILIAANKRIEKGNETIIEFDNNPSSSLSYIKSVNIIKNAATGKDASDFILINDENLRGNSRSIRNNIRLIENNKRDSLNLIRKNNIRFIENRKDSLMLIHNNRVQLIENKRDSLMLIREANRAKTTKGKSSYDAIVFTIEKYTLDQEFDKIKTFFTSHNIDFNSSVKRNEKEKSLR